MCMKSNPRALFMISFQIFDAALFNFSSKKMPSIFIYFLMFNHGGIGNSPICMPTVLVSFSLAPDTASNCSKICLISFTFSLLSTITVSRMRRLLSCPWYHCKFFGEVCRDKSTRTVLICVLKI
jgi:hypothetical protein